MSYEYVTDNNLISKQKYEYTKFRGEEFFGDYLESRESEIKFAENLLQSKDITAGNSSENKESMLCCKIKKLKDYFSANGRETEFRNSLNKLIQSFEVRKRLYEFTDENWKPTGEKGKFDDYTAYLLFAELLVEVYQAEKSLKVFSCLLKLDDTLLSVREKMSVPQRKALSDILKKEVGFYQELTCEYQEEKKA